MNDNNNNNNNNSNAIVLTWTFPSGSMASTCIDTESRVSNLDTVLEVWIDSS